MKIVERFGKLILLGDQLTVQSIENAFQSRKDSCTDFEAFNYIHVVKLGDFHMEMNAVIKSIQSMMPSESSIDKASLSYFARRLVIEHLVSNKANMIKKVGNYQMNQQFFVTVGREFLRSALKTFFKDHILEIEKKFNFGCQNLLNIVCDLMNQFLELHNIKLWYDPTDSPSFSDDLKKYASDASARVLLVMVFSHAIKYGDTECIRACHRVFVAFFYAHDGNVSKYAPCIMNNLVDYEASSEKGKKMIDLFSSVNCYGKEGYGVPADMVCEWSVKSVKHLENRFNSTYEVLIIKKTKIY